MEHFVKIAVKQKSNEKEFIKHNVTRVKDVLVGLDDLESVLVELEKAHQTKNPTLKQLLEVHGKVFTIGSVAFEFKDSTLAERKHALITRNLQEVLGQKTLKESLQEKDLKVYWGTACTGAPHVGYMVPIFKIADFLEAGMHVKILFADVHAFLDNMKSTWELLQKRTMFYQFIIKEMLKLVGVPLDKLEFVVGSSFQLSSQYTLDVYKMSAKTSILAARHSGADVVKQSDDPSLSGMLYPILQALDEEYLKVDCQFGGVDQRKIFCFARERLPKIGYKKRIHLMNPLIPGLGSSGKMSSSEKDSKVDFLDTDKQVTKKIAKAFAEPGNIEQNGILAILKYIIFRTENELKFEVKRAPEHGGDIVYYSYQEIEDAYAKEELSPADLKQAFTPHLLRLVSPLRAAIEKNIDLYYEAYPDAKPKEAKAKKGKKAKASNPFSNYVEIQLRKAREENEKYKTWKDAALRKELDLGRKFGAMSDEDKAKYA